MKYQNEIEINLPINQVIALFDDPENMKQWQPGLERFEHLSGTPGQPGAKSRLIYNMSNRKIEMIETIKTRNLPDEFTGTYEAKGVYNLISNKFIPVGANKTKWVTETEFQFSGFMKLIGWLMPGTFKKQSQKFLQDFKTFAEKQT